MNSPPLPPNVPSSNLLPLFFCVWFSYPVASLFLFSYSGFLFSFFFPSSLLNVLNVYTLFWFCIYPFFFLSSLSSRIFNFLCTIFLFTFIHTNITSTYTLSHPTPLPAQMHTCAYSPFCACIITNPHTTHVYNLPAICTHPTSLFFFSPPSHQKTIHNPLNSFI